MCVLNVCVGWVQRENGFFSAHGTWSLFYNTGMYHALCGQLVTVGRARRSEEGKKEWVHIFRAGLVDFVSLRMHLRICVPA